MRLIVKRTHDYLQQFKIVIDNLKQRTFYIDIEFFIVDVMR